MPIRRASTLNGCSTATELIIGCTPSESHDFLTNSANKKVVIGVDEAGYGPNLGPLVIAASVWEVLSDWDEAMIAKQLGSGFQPKKWTSNSLHIPLGDSKKLYQSSGSLATLEAGVAALVCSASGCGCQTLADLLACHADLQTGEPVLDWYQPREQSAFLIHAPETVQRLQRTSTRLQQKLGIRHLRTHAIVIGEPDFNEQLASLGSKGLVLSRSTLGLAHDLQAQYEVNVEVFCDRQGGRKNYMPLLAEAFPGEWFSEVLISDQRCTYRNSHEREIQIHFSVGGDSFPPTALASMFAKYLRERMMKNLNRFWSEHIPDLKPTAGYPMDAKRFRAAIFSHSQRLGLPERLWWRQK